METPYLENLNDPRVRELMIDELERDVADGTLYISRRLTPIGGQQHPDLLRQAFQSGNPDALARRLDAYLVTHEPTARGPKRVPYNAAETLAFGEFGRFYARAVCRRAIELGQPFVQVCRVRVPENARPDSDLKVGSMLSAERLLEDLRRDPTMKNVFGVPNGPNSGINVRLVRREVA